MCINIFQIFYSFINILYNGLSYVASLWTNQCTFLSTDKQGTNFWLKNVGETFIISISILLYVLLIIILLLVIIY